MCGRWIAFDTPVKAGIYHRKETCVRCKTPWKVTIYRTVGGKVRYDWTAG